MKAFAYAKPSGIADAVAAVEADPDASYLAGGTNLVDLMRLGVSAPTSLVDVRDVVDGEIDGTSTGGLRIGAGATNSDVAAHRVVRRDYPVLSQALLAGASGQLRNRATVGGNLLQRTRCAYFTDPTKPCNKRTLGSGCPARSGAHRDLAVLGTSQHCIATHPSDMAVALAMLGARVRVVGPTGERVEGIDALYRLPDDDPTRDTTLAHADLIVAVELPPPSALTRDSTYRKVRDRASYAFALCSVAAALRLEQGVIAEVALAFGGLAPKPWRAALAEEQLLGGALTRTTVDAAVDAELASADALPGNAFKLVLARRLAAGALAGVAGVELGAEGENR